MVERKKKRRIESQRRSERKKREEEAKKKEEEAKKRQRRPRRRKKKPESREAKKAEEAEAEEGQEGRGSQESRRRGQKESRDRPQKFDNFDDFIGFDINGNTNDEDMLSNMDYEDLKLDDKVPATTDNNLDMNNILENDELILDGLNMTLLDNGDHVNEEFDVDSF